MINITSKTENTVRLFDSGRQQTNVDRESNTENMYTVKNIRAAGQLIFKKITINLQLKKLVAINDNYLHCKVVIYFHIDLIVN